MKQHGFEQDNHALWQQFDDLIEDAGKRQRQLDQEQHYELPALYRRICHHYAIAKQRHYSPGLINELHYRVLQGHQVLYEHNTSLLWRLLEFVWFTFPGQVRTHWRHVWLAIALFYLPAIILGTFCYFDSEMIYQVMPDYSVAEMEYMYDPGNEKVGRNSDRQADTDFAMFGFYIFNNISIGFRTYAMGIFAGIGTIFLLFFNGLTIGGVAGHLTQLGFTETFWPFVSGHGSFELTAICISGAAGLRLAQPLIAPGQYSRLEAFKIAGKDSVQLAMGAGLMFFIAAFIEAFWSPSTLVMNEVKYSVAAVLWLLVIAYLLYAGRDKVRPHAD